ATPGRAAPRPSGGAVPPGGSHAPAAGSEDEPTGSIEVQPPVCALLANTGRADSSRSVLRCWRAPQLTPAVPLAHPAVNPLPQQVRVPVIRTYRHAMIQTTW